MNKNFRAPAVPLITHDPLFSMWSFADRLTDDVVRHWDGVRKHAFGLLVVDNEIYEFMSHVHTEDHYHPGYRKMEQTGCVIRPMSTIYTFENEKVTLELTFTSPLLLNDLKVLARPSSYITYKVTPKDGEKHTVYVYFGFTAEQCVNTNDQQVWLDGTMQSTFFCSGTDNMLIRSGDAHHIEWGEFHVIAPDHFRKAGALRSVIAVLRRKFSSNLEYINTLTSAGNLGPEGYGEFVKTAVYPKYPTIYAFKEYAVEGAPIEGHIAVGYNDYKSIQYFGENIEPYWRKDGETFNQIIKKAITEYDEVMEKVRVFEDELLTRARAVSEEYADIVSVSYRQAIAAHKLTWHDSEVQFISKENYSNGCAATVDVTYPSIPLFLIYQPDLVEGMLNPIFKMVDLGLWDYDFAPHDAGQYPILNGQRYGYWNGNVSVKDPFEYQMPVEECGNMLLCVGALCRARKDYSYFEKHLATLTQWADYLVKVGYDPENQLCTDDFAGHLAHNCNLSVKGICGLAVMAEMLQQTGRNEKAAYYRAKAEEMVASWEANALDGDHYRLAFDQPGTWSLKYNMVWDKLFDLKLFSQKVYDLELNYYKQQMRPYGIPLDSRSDYTKTDWQMWTTVLFDDKAYTDEIVNRMHAFLCESPDRVPFSDWNFVSYPKVRGFQARSVQGGLFINLLSF